MSLTLQTGNPKCDCGKPIDQEGYHLLTCKTGGGPVWIHNTIASVWSECLKHLNKKLIQEPRNRYCNSDDRPEIAVFDISTGSSYELDFAMAHPFCLMCSQELPMRMLQQHSEQRRGSAQSTAQKFYQEAIFQNAYHSSSSILGAGAGKPRNSSSTSQNPL